MINIQFKDACRSFSGKLIKTPVRQYQQVSVTTSTLASGRENCRGLLGTTSSKKIIGEFHLERKESKPKARVRMNKDIEMNPKADDSHSSTNEAKSCLTYVIR